MLGPVEGEVLDRDDYTMVVKAYTTADLDSVKIIPESNWGALNEIINSA